MYNDSIGRALVDFYVEALTYLQPHLSLDEVQKLAMNASIVAMEYGKAHPYQTVFTAVSVGLTPFLGAGWMTAPLLKLIGFGPLGPIAGEKSLHSFLPLSITDMIYTIGSMATWYQATWLGAYIPAGSVFATFQSLAMTAA